MSNRKRLCVLQVTPAEPNPEHVEMFANKQNCDFYFVTHDYENSNALKFCPNTVWSETRNILVELVPKKYDYYGTNFVYTNSWIKANVKSKQSVIRQFFGNEITNNLPIDFFDNSSTLTDLSIIVIIYILNYWYDAGLF